MRTLIAILLIAVGSPAAAQTPYLVKDINATGPNRIISSSPSNFIRLGSRVLFTATTSWGADALWSTDGTEAGTTHIVDIDLDGSTSDPSRFVLLNGKVLFRATDPHGAELWTTDGTTGGTHLLADIASGGASSYPGDRIVYHGQMIFTANDGVHGAEPWITDGTTPGTRLLRDLTPGKSGSSPHSFVLLKDAVYFGTDDALWKTDGTGSGTVKVASVPANDLTATAFGLFFFGGKEPWVSDGTEGGTHKLSQVPLTRTDLDAGSEVTPFGNRVLFIAEDNQGIPELGISDGTAAGTHRFGDFESPDGLNWDPFITIVGEQAFFLAYSVSGGNALWRTDGTEAGTARVREGSAFGLVAVGNNVYFTTTQILNSGGLWVTDGTAAGTHQIKRPYPAISRGGDNHKLLTNIDGVLYFAGSNGVNGYELWKSDGTDAGTSMIANLAPELPPGSYPHYIRAAGDWIYFDTWDGTEDRNNYSLWRSDGTPEGTLQLTAAEDYPVASVGRTLFFNKGSSLSQNLVWTSDGTPEGTAPADPLAKRFPQGAYLDSLIGDTFFAIETVPGYCCQSTNDLAFAASARSSAPAIEVSAAPTEGVNGVNFAGRTVYASYGDLSTTDGTIEGTYDIATLNAYTQGMTVMGGNIFFVLAPCCPAAPELWKSDGTADGTTLVTTLPSAKVDNLMPAERSLFFIGDGQLWVTDGTQDGTHSLPAFPNYPYQYRLAAIGNRVLFQASDAAYGAELWISDGTAEGTHPVADLYPGPAGSWPSGMTSIGGLVYFSANHDLFGRELWVTDGTPAGTRLLADLEPGIDSSSPAHFVRAGNRIFFSATTKAFGRELWAMATGPTPSLTIGDIRVAEGDSGDSAARFTVTLSSPASKVVTAEYATDDGTARDGSDYDATSGKLFFGPGETSKSIDVRVHGNSIPENNRAFFLTLRNPTNAILEKSTAFALIEDDDQLADVALALDFSQMSTNKVISNATNSGPRSATTINVQTTVTPASNGSILDSTGHISPCRPCSVGQLTPGAATKAFTSIAGTLSKQQYFSATATAHQRDPLPANNSVGWITNGSMAMDALFLSPGLGAHVWISTPVDAANVAVESSDPSIISLLSTVQTIAANKPASFVAQGRSIGTATLRVLANGSVIGLLTVDVVAAGTRPRWPGAIAFSLSKKSVVLGQTTTFSIGTAGTAPYSGATATGVVTITSKGRELGRITLTPSVQQAAVTLHPTDAGVIPIIIEYSGDANFLPMRLTSDFSVTLARGRAAGH